MENTVTESNISDYTVEVVTDFTEEFVDYIASICDKRSKEIKELNDNYTSETIRRCFATDRFAHGFFIIKERGDVVITFGIDNFKGWGVLSRLLTHKPGGWRYLWGIAWPVIAKHTEGKVIGICSTHNIGRRDVITTTRKKLLKRTATNPLKEMAAEVHKNTNMLDFKVVYRGTVQEVVTYYTDLIPPFDRV